VKPAPPVIAAITPAPEPVAPARSTKVRTGWMVQVGAFATESEAKQHLEEAQSKAKKLLGRADPFTEPVTKDDKTYYRARFSGLERDQAETDLQPWDSPQAGGAKAAWQRDIKQRTHYQNDYARTR